MAMMVVSDMKLFRGLIYQDYQTTKFIIGIRKLAKNFIWSKLVFRLIIADGKNLSITC